eukprot:1317752-Amorphochlora_amoeboformis.AAC.1
MPRWIPISLFALILTVTSRDVTLGHNLGSSAKDGCSVLRKGGFFVLLVPRCKISWPSILLEPLFSLKTRTNIEANCSDAPQNHEYIEDPSTLHESPRSRIRYPMSQGTMVLEEDVQRAFESSVVDKGEDEALEAKKEGSIDENDVYDVKDSPTLKGQDRDDEAKGEYNVGTHSRKEPKGDSRMRSIIVS